MGKQIVVMGGSILDVLVRPVKKDVFEKGSVPVEEIRLTTGGDALNEATILARLGCQAALVTLLGEDEAGNTILAHCEREGISRRYICRDREIPTGINVVMVQEDGSRSFFTDPGGTLRKLSAEHAPREFLPEEGIFCLASIFVSPLLGAGELEEIFARAKSHGMTVCADMTKCKNHETARDIQGALAYVDWLFANEEEAALITGLKKPSPPAVLSEEPADIEAAAAELLACGVKQVVIKLGGRGCYMADAQGGTYAPALPPKRCIDTTGAGDAFAAGFLCALSEGKSPRECARWANACGSLTVEQTGAASGIQNRRQVEERLDQ